jgi:hypothetical protein
MRNSSWIGHFNMVKLHIFNHYVTWTKKIRTLDDVNTALTEALHEIVKAAFHHCNKVNYIIFLRQAKTGH